MTTYLDRMKDEYRELAERRRKLHAAIPELGSRLDPEDVDLLRRQHVAMDEYCRMLALRIGRAQTAKPTSVRFTADVTLASGEIYAGLILDAEGQPRHHLILLPGAAEDLEWEEAKAWAIEAGGELPTRQEQALLYANCKAHFQRAWYWSSEAHDSYGSYAWCQSFLSGSQLSYRKDYTFRARAVRLIQLAA